MGTRKADNIEMHFPKYSENLSIIYMIDSLLNSNKILSGFFFIYIEKSNCCKYANTIESNTGFLTLLNLPDR